MAKIKSLLANNWLSLKKPTEYFLVDTCGNGSVFEVETLEGGFGLTLGTALRRILLSSLHGLAITCIKIAGVEHEYSTIQGVKEDVINIILNLKSIVFSSNNTDKRTGVIDVVGPLVVTAGMIKIHESINIINPDLVICNLGDGEKLKMEVIVDSGKGYVPSEIHRENYNIINQNSNQNSSVIYIDSVFSPIVNVTFKVEDTRVGAATNFDRLYLTIETNGAITPDTALALAAKILQDQLQIFVNPIINEVTPVKDTEEDKLPFEPILLTRVDTLELSVRSSNCLKYDNIIYLGDLVTKSESRMLQTPNFGRKSLNELKDILTNLGLRFSMEIPGWPPENLQELAKKYEEQSS